MFCAAWLIDNKIQILQVQQRRQHNKMVTQQFILWIFLSTVLREQRVLCLTIEWCRYLLLVEKQLEQNTPYFRHHLSLGFCDIIYIH